MCWCLVCSEGRDRATAAWLQRAGQVGDELKGQSREVLGQIGQNYLEEDTAQAVEAEENFLMKHSFQKNKVVSDTAKLIFMALKTLFEKTFAEGRLRYKVGFGFGFFFSTGCKYLVLLSEFLVHFGEKKKKVFLRVLCSA